MQTFISYPHYFYSSADMGGGDAFFEPVWREDEISCLSDAYKSMNGFRPRYMYGLWRQMDAVQIKAEWAAYDAQWAEVREDLEAEWEQRDAEIEEYWRVEAARSEEERESTLAYETAELVGGRDSSFAPFWR